MKHILLCLFIIFAPIIYSPSAISSVLPCENMPISGEIDEHAQHAVESDALASYESCSCDHDDCRISNTMANSALLEVDIISTYVDQIVIPIPNNSSLQVGVYSLPFKPPIQI